MKTPAGATAARSPQRSSCNASSRYAVGASGRRGHGHGIAIVGHQSVLGFGMGRAAARTVSLPTPTKTRIDSATGRGEQDAARIDGLGACAGGGSAQPAWAIAGCDAFSAALRAGVSDMGVEFSHAIVVSRTRSDANVFDVTTKVDVDATLSCRGDALFGLRPGSASRPTRGRRRTSSALMRLPCARPWAGIWRRAAACSTA